MHDLRTLVEVSNGFLVFARVDLHDTAVEIVILFIEDVLFIVVGLFGFFSISLVIALIRAL